MTPEVTTLPISPLAFWIIAVAAAVVLLSAIVYWALTVLGRDYRPPIWEDLPERGQVVSILLGMLWIGLFGLTIVAAYLGVWQAIQPKGPTSQPNLGLGALLAALLGAPFVIWGTWLKYQTVRFQKEGHMTDRINTAVEQLGAEKVVKLRSFDSEGKSITSEETQPNIEVRIGAILSLERIAQDSTIHDKGRDHVRVMEILCAYVRENAKAVNLTQTPTPFMTKKPRLDVQKAIDVIKRRTSEQVAHERLSRYRLDLRDTDLDGCDLSKGYFAGAIFWRSRFEAADLRWADLTGTQMHECLLNFAILLGATLRGTNLNNCTLATRNSPGILSANLDSIFVEGANIRGFYIGKPNAKAIFGSRDTQVAFGQEDDKDEGLMAAEHLYLDELVKDGEPLWPKGKEVGDAAKNFLHWNPYTYNDLASSEFRDRFKDEKGLHGWPHDD